LTIQERQLIKWRYVDGKRSSDISLKINEHPNTVREHLKEIREKIVLIIKNDEELQPLLKQFGLIKKDKNE
jgi:DNA-binding CsgD family transcriptional regulator